MTFFDFHHHKRNNPSGIYNLMLFERPSEHLFSAGIHPKDIDVADVEKSFNWLKEVSEHKNCIAIGECGLDSFVGVDIEIQKTIFRNQIFLANEIKKPIIVHCVRRFQELIALKKTAKIPLVVHGFHKKKSVADELLKHGFYLSFGNAVLQQLSLQQTISEFPLEKLFLETDNADFKILKLYEKVAEIKKITVEDIENQVLINLERIKNG